MDKFISFCAQYLVWAAPVIVIGVWLSLEPKMRRILFLRALAVAALGIAFAKIGGLAYFEHRPFVTNHLKPLIPHIDDNGFPSDHTLLALGCAFLIAPFSLPASIVVGIIGLIVGWARVASLLHTPLDIVASLIFAIIANLLAKALIRRTPKLSEVRRMNQNTTTSV